VLGTALSWVEDSAAANLLLWAKWFNYLWSVPLLNGDVEDRRGRVVACQCLPGARPEAAPGVWGVSEGF